MKKVTLTRKELYDLVWAEPLSKLAKKYKISDNGLRKICKRMNIPIPTMGHWQKIQYCKPVSIIKLTTEYEGKDEIILSEKGEVEEEADSAICILRKQVHAIENTKGLPLIVPNRFSSRPDKLITSTFDYYEAVKRYYRSQYRGNYPDKINVLNIDVKEENRPRALRILDTLIKVLKARNHDVKVSQYTTYAVVDDESINFRLREKQRVSDIKDKWGGRQYESTGEFVFVIDISSYNRKEVKDGNESLENKISTIVAMLELEAIRMKEEKIRSEIQRKIREEQQRIEREFKEKQDKEVRAFKQLFLQAIRLHQANILRNYIRAVETDAIKSEKLTDEFTGWKTWAENKVSWYDPLINGSDQLLNDYHKTNIFKDLLREWQ